MKERTKIAAAALAALLAAAAAAGQAAVVEGFVGRSPTETAPGQTVKLLDGKSGGVVDITETNLFGKYKFKNVSPGYYRLQSGNISREIMVKGKDEKKRLDIDLSAKDGAMDYGKPGRAAAAGTKPAGGAKAGPDNAGLKRQIAGTWWGYSGSTERSIGLCPDGSYRDSTESGYSGSASDSLGNQTMSWGTASQGGGSGSWTIEGDARSGVIHVRYNDGSTRALRYRQIGDPGCLDFNGNTLCRKSADCRE